MHANRKYITLVTLALLLTVRSAAVAVDLSKFSLAPAFELAPEAKPEPLPLRWMDGRVFVRVRINDREAGWFLVSTGASCSGVASAVAKKLELPTLPQHGLIGRCLPTHLVWHRAERLQVGAASASDVRLTMIDYPKMSGMMMDAYGEGVSGVLGWDLLKTLPFVLDEPGLSLLWQRQAQPDTGAVRVPITETNGTPFIGITLGGTCKVPALLDSAWASSKGIQRLGIKRAFLQQHAGELWTGLEAGFSKAGSPAPDDDDDLPVPRGVKEQWHEAKWLKVECGGLTETAIAEISESTDVRQGDAQIGYGLLRRARALFDGPGKGLWLTPVNSSPVVTLLDSAPTPPTAAVLVQALISETMDNDPVAIRRLAAAGVDFNKPIRDTPHAALSGACSWNSQAVALALMEAGAVVNPIRGQALPLIGAAETPVLFRALLTKGADPNRANDLGVTPLMAAARGNPATVEMLRGKARFPKDAEGYAQVLGDACLGGNLALAKEMLVKIPEADRSGFEWPAILEQTLLLGHQDVAEWILKFCDPEQKSEHATLPPLLAAILPTSIDKTDEIREDLVIKLLAKGADPNAAYRGVTPLLLAARHGNARMVTSLLNAGAKTTHKDYKLRDALQRAAAANQPAEVIAPLLKAGADLTDDDSETGRTALATYAFHGNAAACRLLLDAGADPNGRDTFGPHPLSMAIPSTGTTNDEALSVVKLLLERGAKSELADTEPEKPGVLYQAIIDGRCSLIKPLVMAGTPLESTFARVSPLGWACAMPSTATVSALLELGANPRVMDRNGITPLCHAAAAGRADNVKLLLDHGVSPDATDPLGVPPIWVAASCGQTRAVRLLLAAGAKAEPIHPANKTTALEAARSRHDRAIIALLEATAPEKQATLTP